MVTPPRHEIAMDSARSHFNEADHYSLEVADGYYDRAVAEAYIRDSLKQWRAACSTRDISAVRRILADGFVWQAHGNLADKADAIAEAMESDELFDILHSDYIDVRFEGDVIISHGSVTSVNTLGEWARILCAHYWERRDGQWQIVKYESRPVDRVDHPDYRPRQQDEARLSRR